MVNSFFVPIHLDALLSDGSPVRDQMTDYTQLPYLNENGVQNDGVAYISDRIRSKMVFADDPSANLYSYSLEKGLHLHWALPDALTVGKQKDDKLIFPSVPNRWLITRRGGGKAQKQWVIESDYFAPIEQGNPENSISVYLVPKDSEGRQSQDNYYREQPWRFMGRKLTLEDWKSRELNGEYAEALSVVGNMKEVKNMDSEKASFAAFYPNCRSVFGFCDGEINPQKELSEDMVYELVGWYSDRRQDYLKQWFSEWQKDWQKELKQKEDEAEDRNDPEIFSQYQNAGEYKLLTDFKQRFGWGLSEADQSKLIDENERPQRIICYSRITFKKDQTLMVADNVEGTFDTKIAIGNTATEALLAYLAKELATDSNLGDYIHRQYPNAKEKTVKAILEEQLEAISMTEGGESQKLDVSYKFAENRHENGFTSVNSGIVWRLVTKGENSSLPQEQVKSIQAPVTLPDRLAYLLNDLNLKQSRYEQELQAIESERQYLFADWHKYLSSRYPGYFDSPYPDAHQIKFYLKNHAIPKLKLKLKQMGATTKQIEVLLKQRMIIEENEDNNLENLITSLKGILEKEPHPPANATIIQLYRALLTLCEEIKEYNLRQQKQKDEQKQKDCITYSLEPSSAPRYWQPNNPVVLMVGDGIKPSPRHGQDEDKDGQDKDKESILGGLIGGKIVADNFDLDNLPPATLNSLRNEIDTIASETKEEENIGLFTWNGTPWNPFLLEWLVQYFPNVKGEEMQKFKKKQYGANYINENYQLKVDDVDLSLKDNRQNSFLTPSPKEGAAYHYRGFSLLTPYAVPMLQNKLKRLLVTSYCRAEKEKDFPPIEETESYFQKYETKIKTWVNSLSLNQYPGVKTAIYVLDKLENLDCLSQSLGSFNDALLTFEREMQLPIANPLYKTEDDFELIQDIKELVGNTLTRSPLPFNPFCPVRGGVMNLLNLQLIDTFGRVKIIPTDSIIPIEQLKAPPEAKSPIFLPPRLIQPARVNFRWLAADPVDEDGNFVNNNNQQMNEHPVMTPICGWVLPNKLNGSLMIYDKKGQGLGYIDNQAKWRSMPGKNGQIKQSNNLLTEKEIANPHLRKMANYLLIQGKGGNFLAGFSDVLNEAIETIDPESFAQYESLALLMGQPLALVRAMVNLEVHGPYARNQNSHSIYDEMVNWKNTTYGFEKVKFPIRIGEDQQLNDGLVGYWLEKNGEYENNIFYAPQSNIKRKETSNESDQDLIITRAEKTVNLEQSVSCKPQILTMLFDPRGKVHATSGILPTKAIDIPKEQFVEALKAMEITFLTAPILIDNQEYELDQLGIPIPQEPEYEWSWITKEGEEWQEKPKIEEKTQNYDGEAGSEEDKPIQLQKGFVKVTPEATFTQEIRIREGWLKLKIKK